MANVVKHVIGNIICISNKAAHRVCSVLQVIHYTYPLSPVFEGSSLKTRSILKTCCLNFDV